MIRVEKLWGHEEWLVNNELYCAKILTLRFAHQCSLHRHAVKDETFCVRSGKVWIEIGDDARLLLPGDKIRIHPNTWHRFAGLSHSTILEVSTHHDDADVERNEESRRLTPAELEQLNEHARLASARK